MANRGIELSMPEDFGRRLKDPANSSIFHYETYLPFTEAVKLDRGNANVRPPKDNPPYKEMMKSVAETPGFFTSRTVASPTSVRSSNTTTNLAH